MDSFVANLADFQVGSPSDKQRGKFVHYHCAVEFKCKQVLAKIVQKASNPGRAG